MRPRPDIQAGLGRGFERVLEDRDRTGTTTRHRRGTDTMSGGRHRVAFAAPARERSSPKTVPGPRAASDRRASSQGVWEETEMLLASLPFVIAAVVLVVMPFVVTWKWFSAREKR